MKINGRLLLLVAVAALFVRVWSINDPLRGRHSRRTWAHTSRPVVATPVVARTSVVAVIPVSVARTPESSLPTEPQWSVADCPLPVPAGIEPGTYRVASDDGRIARLTIPAASDVGASMAAGPDLLAVTVEGVRWYFIRLNVAVDAADEMPARGRTVEDDASREAVVADTLAVPPDVSAVIQQAERPRPPALPSPL